MSPSLSPNFPRRLLAIALALAAGAAVAAPGDLDPGFDGDGKLVTPFGGRTAFVSDLAVQSDGKIVAVGNVQSLDFSRTDWLVLRYNADGSPDTGFGTGGQVTTTFGRPSEQAAAVTILANGQILVAGSSGDAGSTMRFAVARYNPDGSLDSGFDGDGKAEVAFPESDAASASGLAVQADGKIVLAGIVSFGGTSPASDFALARLTPDGSLDATFGGDGTVTQQFGPYRENALDVALQGDGKILVNGYQDLGDREAMAVARFNPDGGVDAAFGTGGLALGDFGDQFSYSYGIAVQPDGKIVLAGNRGQSTAQPYVENCVAARFNADGTLDLGFGTGGAATIDFKGENESCQDLGLEAGGRLVLAGRTQATGGGFSPADAAVYRLNPDGGLDTGFGENGRRVIDFLNDSYDFGNVLALTGDGKVVVGAGVTSPSGGDIGLARLEAGGAGPTGGGTAGETPRAFSFKALRNVRKNTRLKSNTVTIKGLKAAVSISVVNGEYAIGCKANQFTRQPGTLKNGQKVCVRHQSSAEPGGVTETILTVGGRSAVFRSTTKCPKSVAACRK
jgi:uncharacterized delta-60 repeat protein